MLIVETIARIRREHFVQGKTIKEIARDLRLSTEYGSQGPAVGGDSFSYEHQVQRPKLGRWKEGAARRARGSRQRQCDGERLRLTDVRAGRSLPVSIGAMRSSCWTA